MKKISILGSTGSIGTQTLDVIANDRDHFEIIGLSSWNNTDLLLAQIERWKPQIVAIGTEEKAKIIRSHFPELKILIGESGIEEIAALPENDLVVNAIVGFAGLRATVASLEMGKKVALANKESLVVAGDLIATLMKNMGGEIIPIDSEHSAIFQCIEGHRHEDIEKIILTASGGPFLRKTRQELQDVSKAEALKHPNWEMGSRITIDSATMMNKGFEVIEAMYLFNLSVDQIEVIIHPQSSIHSFVQFRDGNILAQANPPDMRFAISYALYYPERGPNDFPRLDLTKEQWSFEQPKLEQFPCLKMAYEVAQKGGTYGAVFNAADEVAVQLFLEEKIAFLEIETIIQSALDQHEPIARPSLQDIAQIDQETRTLTHNLVHQTV